MKKMLKLGIFTLMGIIGVLYFMSNNDSKNTEGGRDEMVIFGHVDLSDDEDYRDHEDYQDDEGDEGNWFETFIKNHKTPFSKEIHK